MHSVIQKMGNRKTFEYQTNCKIDLHNFLFNTTISVILEFSAEEIVFYLNRRKQFKWIFQITTTISNKTKDQHWSLNAAKSVGNILYKPARVVEKTSLDLSNLT